MLHLQHIKTDLLYRKVLIGKDVTLWHESHYT